MEELEQAIATIKAFPKPGIMYYWNKLQASSGGAGVPRVGPYKRIAAQAEKRAEEFKSRDIANFDKMLPEVERLQRKVRMYFGEDPKVKGILKELEGEVETKTQEIAAAKMLAMKVGAGIVAAIVVLYLILIMTGPGLTR